MTKTATPFELKALDEEKRTFTGMASTWDLDLGNDVIERGAFKRTLNAWKAGGRVLPLIDQHNYGSVRSVVGKLIAAAETDAGLEATFEIIEGPDGDEILRRVKGGYIASLSIGYEAVKWEMEVPEGADAWDAIRHLKEVKLYEVSVVIWPMNPEAVIDPNSVKNLAAALRNASPEERNQIRALLDAPPPAPPEGAPADTSPTDPAQEKTSMEPAAQVALSLRLRLLTLKSPAARRHALRT
jgi:HK97 family phage prohead protease